MDIQARKILFVQEFLRVADDELVTKLESLLRIERKKKFEEELRPMTLKELNEIIDKSEDDIKKGKVTEARNLLNQIDMEVKVLWTDSSLAQLQEIFDYYNLMASTSVASKIVKRIVKKSLLLESNPLIGVKEPLLADRTFEYRFIVVTNYKIIYRFNDNIARIVSVFDCRQNPQKIENLKE